MSGLGAVFHANGRPADGAAVRAMLDSMPYRGPDGHWTYTEGPVALGFAKMAVTREEEDERQPLISPRTGCAVIADVRLDNRDELRRRLPVALPPAVSDAELILCAYEAWGPAAPEYLLGDFAFVVFDPRSRSLVCARDTSGQRTLYYRWDGRTFGAASEIHGLLQDPAVPLAPNEARIRDFLVPLNMFRNEKEREDTFYAGIKSLLPGHVLTVGAGGFAIRRYWELTPGREIRYRSDGEYAEHFLEIFSEAVRCRLRTSRPMGAMLSGGLDSSSIVSTALHLARTGRGPAPDFTAYSLFYDGLECDERPLVRDVQAAYDVPVEYVSPEGYYQWLQEAPQGFRISPTVGINERDAIFKVASGQGVRVLLSGDVADATIRGSLYVFDSLLRQGRWSELRRYLDVYRESTGDHLLKVLALYCLRPYLPLPVQRRAMQAFTRRSHGQVGWRLVPPWLPEAWRQDLSRRHLELSLEMEGQRQFANETRHLTHLAIAPPEFAANPAGWPLEHWRPFADRRLHEFVLAVPPEQLYRPHPTATNFYAGAKRLLRESMRGILPESIRTRTAPTDFASVFEQDVQRRWLSYERVFGPVAQPEIASRGYVDHHRFWGQLVEMHDGGAGSDLIYMMRFVGLESWLRTFRLPRSAQVSYAGNGPAVAPGRGVVAAVSSSARHPFPAR